MHRNIATPRASALLALCALWAPLAGCSLVPTYDRPAVAAADTWDGASKTLRDAVAVRGAWWQGFNSAELDQLMQRSLAQSYTLDAAIARIEQAGGTAEIAGAAQYPRVTIGGTRIGQTGVRNSSTQQVLAQASYEIDFWGRNRAAAQSSQALAQATAFDADTVAMTLTASVANTYFQILSLQERVRLARQIAADGRRVLALIEVQRAAGTATDLQVQQQISVVATFDATVPALQLLSDQALHLLATLTGQPPQGFAIQATDLTGLARPEIRPDLPSTLLDRRPDIRAAEARLISANFDIGVARAAYYPSVSLSAVLGFGARNISNFFPPAAISGVGAALLQPLFLGGQLEGQLRFTRARQIEYVASYRQAILTAFQEVEDALSAVSRSDEQERIVVVAEAAALRASDLAQLQYRLGAADYLTVLTTEQALYRAQDTLLQLRLLRLQALVGLSRAMGGGFDAPEGPSRTPADAPTPAAAAATLPPPPIIPTPTYPSSPTPNRGAP